MAKIQGDKGVNAPQEESREGGREDRYLLGNPNRHIAPGNRLPRCCPSTQTKNTWDPIHAQLSS